MIIGKYRIDNYSDGSVWITNTETGEGMQCTVAALEAAIAAFCNENF